MTSRREPAPADGVRHCESNERRRDLNARLELDRETWFATTMTSQNVASPTDGFVTVSRTNVAEVT